MQIDTQDEKQPLIQDEIKELMNELKNNNLNGNEIIAVLKDENTTLKASLIDVRDQLLDMLTRGEQDDKPSESSNTTV